MGDVKKPKHLKQAELVISTGLKACALQVFLILALVFTVLVAGFGASTAEAAEINTAYVGLELRLNGTEIYANLLRTWPNQKINSSAPVASDAGISLSSDLHQRVQNGQLSPSDALQIESELMMRHGSVYYLPATQDELKEAVGFPRDEPLSAVDLRDLIPVHTQMSLGVGVMASSYLVEKLKVKITVSEAEAAAAGLPVTPSPTPVAPPSPAVSPEPALKMVPTPSLSPPQSVPATTEAAVPPAAADVNSASNSVLNLEPPVRTPVRNDAPAIPQVNPPAADTVTPISPGPADPSSGAPRVKAESDVVDQTQS